jgi:hypothetical protein
LISGYVTCGATETGVVTVTANHHGVDARCRSGCRSSRTST